MWIRSQDKEKLLSLETIWIHQTQVRGMNTDYQENEGWILGQFSTKEAALEELDRIEAWIEAGGQGVYQVSQG